MFFEGPARRPPPGSFYGARGLSKIQAPRNQFSLNHQSKIKGWPPKSIFFEHPFCLGLHDWVCLLSAARGRGREKGEGGRVRASRVLRNAEQSAVCCLLPAARCLLPAARRPPPAACCLSRCLLPAACCLLHACCMPAACPLHACCMPAACCMLHAAC